MCPKVMLVVEYDGTDYYGFQWQANAPTVQAELEEAIDRTTQEKLRVVTASRTDTGVHARGQVVSFRTRAELKPERWVGALNFHLPPAVAVRSACYVDDSFNVQKDAVSREYRYYILNRAERSPLLRRFSYQVPQKLDVALMNEACRSLEGEHDFSPFAARGCERAPVRKMFKAETFSRGELVILTMIASGFLAHQVRNTVGALISLSHGRYSLDGFKELAASGRPGVFGPTAPASGLCLMKVNYASIPVIARCS